MINNKNNLTSLNEVYIGKQAVASLQNQFSIVRARFKGRPYNPQFGQDKEVLKFNRMMEKQFGYNEYSLTFNASQSINAYAIPMEYYFSDEEKRRLVQMLKTSRNGFKFDTSKDGYMTAIICFNMGTINADFMTDEELFAILLHEVGHTFYQAVTSGKESYVNKAMMLCNSLKQLNKMILNRISSGKYVSNEEIVKDVENNFKNAAKVILNNFIVKPFNLAKSFINNLFKKEAVEDNFSKKMIRYTDEKFADTFAAIYGYGPDLHSGLQKIYNEAFKQYPQTRNSLFIIIKAYDLYLGDLFAFMMGVQDEHPNDLARMKVAADYLKKEISREGIDPKMKTRMIAQLDELNKIIDDYINFPKDQDNIRIIRTYYTLLHKKFGGDRREKIADNDALFDYIDTRYKDAYK